MEHEIVHFLPNKEGGFILTLTDEPFGFVNKTSQFEGYESLNEGFIFKSERIAFIESIWVKPEYQGQGFQEKIFEILYEVCYNSAVLDIYLIADANLQQELSYFNIVTFYEMKGFNVIKEFKNNKYLMRKELKYEKKTRTKSKIGGK